MVSILAAVSLVYNPILLIALAISSGLVALLIVRPVLLASIVLAIGGIPLAFLTHGERRLFQDFGGVHPGGMLLAILLPSILLFILSHMHRFPDLDRSYNAAVWTAMAFGLFALISLTYSPAPAAGIRLLFKLLFPPAFGVFLFLITRSHADREQLFRGFLLGGVFVTSLSLIRLFMSDSLGVLLQGNVIRHSAGFSHPSPFSFYMLSLFGFCYLRGRYQRSLFWMCLAAFFGIQVVLALTRISIFCLVLTSIITEVMLPHRSHRNLRGLVTGITVTFASWILLFSSSLLQKRFFYAPLSSTASLSDLAGSVNDQGRLDTWLSAWRDIDTDSAYFFFGKGLGASSHFLWEEFNPYFLVMHSEYLRIFYDLGLLGILLSGVTLGCLLFALRKARRALTPATDHFYISLAKLYLVYLGVIALTDNPIDYYMMFNQYVFLALAMAVAAPRLAQTLPQSSRIPPPPPTPIGAENGPIPFLPSSVPFEPGDGLTLSQGRWND